MSSSRPSSSGAGKIGVKGVVAATTKKAHNRTSDSLRSSKVAEPSSGPGSPQQLVKRGRGRPPKDLPAQASVSVVYAAPATSSTHLPPPAPSSSPARVVVLDEARKKIANCLSPLGRPRQPPPKRRGGRPGPLIRPPPEESESEDDIPPCFSDVVKIIIKKVQETQNEINVIDECYEKYKKAHDSDTNFAMKFYAAVPHLHERVAAGAAFDDDLIESVFAELFPANGDSKKHKHGHFSEEKAKNSGNKNAAPKKRKQSTAEETSSESERDATSRRHKSSLK